MIGRLLTGRHLPIREIAGVGIRCELWTRLEGLYCGSLGILMLRTVRAESGCEGNVKDV